MTPSHPEQLYYSTTSPYARKARIAAAEKQVPFTPVLDVPWNADTKTIAINPLGKVPVWVMADGTALFDSRVIVEYLDGVDAEKTPGRHHTFAAHALYQRQHQHSTYDQCRVTT